MDANSPAGASRAARTAAPHKSALGKSALGKSASVKRPAGPRWAKVFLAALADTSNVSAAARKAGVSTSAVYERRRSDIEFSRQWQLALCEGYDNPEMELLHRLRSGEVKPAVGAKRAARSFDNGIAFRLLLAHRDSATRARATRENISAAQVRAAIDRKVAEIRARVLANKAAQQALPAPAAGTPVEAEIVEAPADAG